MEKTMRTNAASVLLEILTMNGKSFSTTSEELLDKLELIQKLKCETSLNRQTPRKTKCASRFTS